MEVISSVLNWFSSNILQNPAFFVGLLYTLKTETKRPRITQRTVHSWTV